MNKYKTFLSWMLVTNILYIIFNCASRKVVSTSSDLLMIIYDIAVVIGVVCLITVYISKTVSLKEILQNHYKLLAIVFIMLSALDIINQKYVLSNSYIHSYLSNISYETFKTVELFVYNNLRISIIYIIILFLNQKNKKIN